MKRGVWRATVHTLTGLPVALLGVVVLVAPARGRTVAWRSSAQRARFSALLGVTVDEGAAARKQIAYHLIALPYNLIAFAVVAGAWSAGIGLLVAAVQRPALIPAAAGVPAAAALAARGLARLDVVLARRLLGPDVTEALTARLRELARARADTVAAADAERRRIERDLHDGAQQRLVALALKLGLTRAALPAGPARDSVGEAHAQAKAALAELRDLVRGLHPAVLTDRGLDAALSGLVARQPHPVDLRVDVARRCPPEIEAIAYFVVAEALTNVTRHARATRVEVAVVRARDMLRLTVLDDGAGGATDRPGGGLRGLAQRAGSVDGRLRIESPPGGPTLVEVVLPCGS
ncbi:sensor histidine kinase [Symbioplanes lichenis]|uniref:sensor histidine kinase n=1 Tax=Symbioplanes lichenis TaxID=1629072 RepID=UPI002738FED9|nr:histidine kinase [Actinoplanes lichenis]